MSFIVDDFFNDFKSGEVLVAYKGKVTSDVINGILDQIEEKMLSGEEEIKTIKKLYNIMVEGLQNLYHHSENVPEDLREQYDDKFGIVIVLRKDKGYQVVLGNFVDEKQMEYLKEKIDKINSLTPEELKEMYKFILNHQKLSAKGGGGLGLLDMAKKTKNKLEYNFYNYNNNWYFYSLKLIVT